MKLENDYVEVFVLPQIGGKVWGAIEKSSGEEFIYRNEVVKFRNIAMRGPWTSGGIEFNYGIIGHHPSTATPVDYIVETLDDGSVSCTVGNIDLTSRTQWRVNIVLPKDKAYFETKSLWYNPTPASKSYYNWMTAAAPAREDFEFFTPGDEYLKHSGEAVPWPIDGAGRNLSLYKDNNFGPSKSYHVVGEFNDYFGGYYHDANYGFGHWSEYEEMPGQKLWLWALSRAGGIWEDLLTDTDGQYIEFQAGRLFVQYSPGDHINPVTQANFEPHGSDKWTEIWFPVKSIGGISDASDKAVMNVEVDGAILSIGINPFQDSKATLIVRSGQNVLHNEDLSLRAMDVFTTSVDLGDNTDYEIEVHELGLTHQSGPPKNLIDRPFDSHVSSEQPISIDRNYRQGLENVKFRQFSKGQAIFEQVLDEDPNHMGALVGLGDIHFRRGEYEEGLSHVKRALRLDTYDPAANYTAGILYRGKGDLLNAKESLGWAARSMTHRSAAYAQIAEIALIEEDLQRALSYSDKSLDFNRYNLNALSVQAVVMRLMGNNVKANEILDRITEIDPLNHFAFFEQHLLSQSEESLKAFKERHRSELPYQTYLELALSYHHLGRNDEAIDVLDKAPQHPVIDLWWTYLKKDASSPYFKGIENLSPEFVFPFRRETLKALIWANQHSDHWKFKYYLALNLWGVGRMEEAAKWLKACENTPEYHVFYTSRAHLLSKLNGIDELSDLNRALSLNDQDYRNWRSLVAYHHKNGHYQKALELAHKAQEKFADNYAVGMDYARALIQVEQYAKAIDVLASVNVLPFEGASEGRRLYEQCHFGHALNLLQSQQYEEAVQILNQSKIWPERLGVGKPYGPDERMANFLLSYAQSKLGYKNESIENLRSVANQSMQRIGRKSTSHILGLVALNELDNTNHIDSLTASLLQSQHANSPETRWVLSMFSGRKDAKDPSLKDLTKTDPILRELFKLIQTEYLTN